MLLNDARQDTPGHVDFSPDSVNLSTRVRSRTASRYPPAFLVSMRAPRRMTRQPRSTAANGDTKHEAALRGIKGRWRIPIRGMGWYRKAKRDFAALPKG